MKHLPSILLVLTFAILTACGGDAADTSSSTTAAKSPKAQAASPEVVFKVTGADETEVEGRAHVFCTAAAGPYETYIEIGYVTSRTNLELVLLAGVSGTIELMGSRESGAARGKQNLVHFRSENLTKYVYGSGQLDIKSMPAAQGERFIATMSADLRDKDGNVINIEASFDTDAGSQSFDECPG